MLQTIRNFFERWMPLGGAEAKRMDYESIKAGDWSELDDSVDRILVLPPGLKYTPNRPPQTSIQACADLVS